MAKQIRMSREKREKQRQGPKLDMQDMHPQARCANEGDATLATPSKPCTSNDDVYFGFGPEQKRAIANSTHDLDAHKVLWRNEQKGGTFKGPSCSTSRTRIPLCVLLSCLLFFVWRSLQLPWSYSVGMHYLTSSVQLILPLWAAASTAATFTPLQPPSYPLAVRNPYLSSKSDAEALLEASNNKYSGLTYVQHGSLEVKLQTCQRLLLNSGMAQVSRGVSWLALMARPTACSVFPKASMALLQLP